MLPQPNAPISFFINGSSDYKKLAPSFLLQGTFLTYYISSLWENSTSCVFKSFIRIPENPGNCFISSRIFVAVPASATPIKREIHIKKDDKKIIILYLSFKFISSSVKFKCSITEKFCNIWSNEVIPGMEVWKFSS